MRSIVVIAIFSISPLFLGATERMLDLLTPAELTKVGVCSSAKLTIVICYDGTDANHKEAFVIAKASCENDVYYILKSDVICDAIKYRFKSNDEILDFFSTRFKGIANDLLYGLERPDITNGPNWPSSARDRALMPLAYAGCASAIDDARTTKRPKR